jgi:hypothetical protein
MNLLLRRQGALHPGQFFGIGMSVGVVVGLVLGTLLALRLGEDAYQAVNYLIDRLAGRRDRVNFELLLQ